MLQRAFNQRIKVLLLLVLGGVAACSYNTLIPPDFRQLAAYKTALQDHHRQGKIYKGLETLLLADVVYYAPAYEKAYQAVYFQDHQLVTPAEKEAFIQAETKEDVYRFLVAVFSDRETWHELPVHALGKGSIWTLSLKNQAGEQVKPSSITELETLNEYVKSFGRFYSPWRKYYMVEFPQNLINSGIPLRGQQTDLLLLTFSSLHGSVEFAWYPKKAGDLDDYQLQSPLNAVEQAISAQTVFFPS